MTKQDVLNELGLQNSFYVAAELYNLTRFCAYFLRQDWKFIVLDTTEVSIVAAEGSENRKKVCSGGRHSLHRQTNGLKRMRIARMPCIGTEDLVNHKLTGLKQN